MKLEVLGSGSSGNCYLLHTSCGIIIIEAGVRFNEVLKALDFDISKIICCLISHEHGDHAKYAKEYAQRGGFQLLLSNGTASALDLPQYMVYKEECIKNIHIKMFETQHDAFDPVGFYISDLNTGENLVFATDTYYVKYRFKEANYIMVECNYAEDILQKNIEEDNVDASRATRLHKSHFELSRVKEFITASNSMNLKNVILLHLSSQNSDAERFKEEVSAITLANVNVAIKGLKIELGDTGYNLD